MQILTPLTFMAGISCILSIAVLVYLMFEEIDNIHERNSQCSSMRAHIQMQDMKLKAANDYIENQQKTIEKLSTPLFTSMDKPSARKRAAVMHEIRFQGK